MDFSFDKKEFTYFLNGGQKEYEKYLRILELKEKNTVFSFRPESYSNEAPEHIVDESKAQAELLRLHNSRELDLESHLYYLSDLTPYSRSLELHFTIFKTFCYYFSEKNRQSLLGLVSKAQVIGSCALEEINLDTHEITDKIRTNLTFAENKLILNSDLNTAKFSRYFSPLSSHVIIQANYKLDSKVYKVPVLISLRDPKTLELKKGVTVRWLGPTFGGVSGRDYAIEFKDFEIPVQGLALDGVFNVADSKLTLKKSFEQFEFISELCLTAQRCFDLAKASRESLKASFLVVRYTKNRTQFKTTQEKGKERPIFEYENNLNRIVTSLVDAINFTVACVDLTKVFRWNNMNIEKNSQRLSDFMLFFKTLEGYIAGKLLRNMEYLRESIGGFGFLKYSGVPILLENVFKYSTYTSPEKFNNYLKLAHYLVNSNFEKKSEFLAFHTPGLTEKEDSSNYANIKDFHLKPEFHQHLAARRILHLKNKLKQSNLFKSQNINDISKDWETVQDVTNIAETFLNLIVQSSMYRAVGHKINRENNRLLLILTTCGMFEHFLNDIPSISLEEQKGILPKDSVAAFRKTLQEFYSGVGNKALDIVESFEFNENLLHSSISRNIDETYEKMLNMSKNHNPRNVEANQQEIKKGLIEFLNRPPSKL